MRRIFRTRDYQPHADRDLDDELQSHLELKMEDLRAQGMSEEDALAEARRTLGADGQAKDRAGAAAHTRSRLRRQGLVHRIDTLSRDLRYAFRRMAKSPGFTIIAILSLTIGIGANTAVFSVVNGLFLRPPPFDHPQEVVQILTGRQGEIPSSDVRWAEFEGIREVDDVFLGVGGYDGIFAGLRDAGGTRSAFVEAVTPNLFPLLGIEPILGRPFLPDESSDLGGNPLAILGHRYWMQAFDGDRSVLGQTIHLSGVPFTIIGVAPPELLALQTQTIVTEVFVPMSMAGLLSGGGGPDGLPQERPTNLRAYARLAPGVTLEAAEARVSGIVQEVRAAEGMTFREGWGLRLWSVEHQAIEPQIDVALVKVAMFIMAVAGLVLLLACTNLANLFLAKGVTRKKELALRLALGAGKGRLAIQLFTETVLLSVLGGLGGFFLARWTLDLLFRFQPDVGVTFAMDTSADLRVLFFTLGVVALASFLFGLIPAIVVTRSEITPVLKGVQGPRRGRGLRLRGGMVAFQMAVSIVLLTGSGLFFRSLLAARDADPGFRAAEAVSVQVDLRRSNIPPSEWTRVTTEMKDRAGSQPGIQVLGMADVIPLLNRNTTTVVVPGVDPPNGREGFSVTRFRVDEGYLGAMGIPLLSGRGIQESDGAGAERIVLVNQTAARRYWPGESPLGKTINNYDESHRVVGVVGDVKVEWLSDPSEATVYFPLAQSSSAELYLVARGSVGTGDMMVSLRRALMELDPNLLILQVQSLEDRMGVNLYPIRLAAIYLGAFGLMALILAAIGLYGVVSLSVSRRVREMGIRMSVGADAGRVVGMVLKGSLTSVAIGAAIGLALAIVLARLIQSFLFGVEAADPVTLVAVPLVLGAVAVLAAFIPARRASRVNPVEALRME